MWKFCTILVYIFATFLALLCLTFALSVAYISAVIFLPTYFPTQIHKFSRTWDIESSLDLNDPSVKLSPWGLPYDAECGVIRMVFLDMDCLEPARKCLERIEGFEKGMGKMRKEERERDVLDIAQDCFQSSECMRNMACKEATYQFNKFNKYPHSFFLNYSSFPSCITKFYEVIRDDSFDNCTLNYQFLAKDPLTKNRAYSHGKFCFLSFASDYCDPEIINYLEKYYEFFLEFAMTPTLDGCGIFEKFEALECKESMIAFQKSVELLESGNQTREDYEMIGGICDEMQNCFHNLTNPCGIPQEFQDTTQDYCKKMHFLSSPFWQCVEKLKSENIQFADDSMSCSIFRKDFVKDIMMENCGLEVMNGFDEAKDYLLEMWDCI